MSGIFGVFALHGEPTSRATAQRMLSVLGARGADRSAAWEDEGAYLGVSRYEWECDARFSGDAMVARDGELVIVADASLYYRADLLARLATAGIATQTMAPTPSELILAAYRAWGEQCLQHLEGDFAFIIWDARHRRVCCGRDFAGSRPLFYADLHGTLIVASTLGALQAHPRCPNDFNLPFLAETASNVWLPAQDTAYAAIHALPAGHVVSWFGRMANVQRQWHAPDIEERAVPFADATAQLRELLIRAVAERAGDVTAVWMSGGRDSTAVFGAGQGTLRPVSVSYPPGDPGREDELISAVADRWNAPIEWLRIDEIGFFDRPARTAATRDEPYAPLYQSFSRALASRSRAIGARVALDGWGGDQLFELSPIYLADLLRSGRWLALAREWRALGVNDLRYLFRMMITPTLPPLLRVGATRLRGGRPLPDPAEVPIPAWIAPPWRSTLLERQRAVMPPPPSRGRDAFAARELLVSLTSPTGTRVRGWLSTLALEEGVEVRSPLYDNRIIELAFQRPPAERRTGRETKVLLRAAMQGLLPDHVLAPRPKRTGVIGGYLQRAIRNTDLRTWSAGFDAPVLAEMGIIEPAAFRRAAEQCMTGPWNPDTAAALLFTLQTELWLRARVRNQSQTYELERGAPLVANG